MCEGGRGDGRGDLHGAVAVGLDDVHLHALRALVFLDVAVTATVLRRGTVKQGGVHVRVCRYLYVWLGVSAFMCGEGCESPNHYV